MHGIRRHLDKKIKKGFVIINKEILKNGKQRITLRRATKAYKNISRRGPITYTLILPKAVRKK